MQPLAGFDNSHSLSSTNLSRTVSLTLLDQYGNEIPIRTNATNPVELIIPRDPNVAVSPMALQNVTAVNAIPHQQLFNLHFVNISNALPVSVHFEMYPWNSSLSYLLVYRFDHSPMLNSSINQIDGWTLLCSSSKCYYRRLIEFILYVISRFE